MYDTVSEVIHDQVFLRLRHLGVDQLYLKMECFNPAGSVKMKTALGLINDMQARGRIGPDTILVESSSGNLGVALAMICAERGLRFTCVVDPNSSPHNLKIMRAFGAQVVMVEQRDENGGFLGTRIAYIRSLLAHDPRYLWLNQYENPVNPQVHAAMTASAISSALGPVDYLFVGAGTTGTLMGCVRHFQEHSPATRIVAVDSVGSVTFGHPASKRHIPGLGTSQRPPIFRPAGIHAFEMVPEARAVQMCRFLARSNGVLVGGSTGTVLAAVSDWRTRLPAGARVVAIGPDGGDRYLDSIYDDDWVASHFGPGLCAPAPSIQAIQAIQPAQPAPVRAEAATEPRRILENEA